MHHFSNNPSRTRSQRVAVEKSESNIPAQFAHVGSCTERFLYHLEHKIHVYCAALTNSVGNLMSGYQVFPVLKVIIHFFSHTGVIIQLIVIV